MASPMWLLAALGRRVRTMSRPTIMCASDLASVSAVCIVPADLPARSTVTRSETASTSGSLWEMKTTLVPAAGIPRRVASNHLGEPVLGLEDVSATGDLGTPALTGVSLQVRAGEIVGVAGVAGNGQRELAEVIAGERPATSGTVTIAGMAQPGTPWEAIDAGLGYVPEERLGVGIAPGMTVADNLILKSYREGGPILHAKQALQNAAELIERFSIVARGPKTIARELSGGNIQRLLLARELSGHPKILIAASPTRGLDVAATDSVRQLLAQSAEQGVGVLLISEDLDEILDLSDRIAVMYRGRVVGVVDRDDADIDRIGLMMAGVGS